MPLICKLRYLVTLIGSCCANESSDLNIALNNKSLMLLAGVEPTLTVLQL